VAYRVFFSYSVFTVCSSSQASRFSCRVLCAARGNLAAEIEAAIFVRAQAQQKTRGWCGRVLAQPLFGRSRQISESLTPTLRSVPYALDAWAVTEKLGLSPSETEELIHHLLSAIA
jgi:hypothetical protein